MTYKEKIREEIERRLDILQYKPHEATAFKELKSLLNFINTLTEEPVSLDMEKAAEKAYPGNIHKQSIFIHGAIWANNKNYVSGMDEDLDSAAVKYAQDKYLPVQMAIAFKAGAEWMLRRITTSSPAGQAPT